MYIRIYFIYLFESFPYMAPAVRAAEASVIVTGEPLRFLPSTAPRSMCSFPRSVIYRNTQESPFLAYALSLERTCAGRRDVEHVLYRSDFLKEPRLPRHVFQLIADVASDSAGPCPPPAAALSAWDSPPSPPAVLSPAYRSLTLLPT